MILEGGAKSPLKRIGKNGDGYRKQENTSTICFYLTNTMLTKPNILARIPGNYLVVRFSWSGDSRYSVSGGTREQEDSIDGGGQDSFTVVWVPTE